MTAHEHLDHELIELLAGETSPQRRAALGEALRSCDICRSRYEELAEVVADVATAAPAVTPPLGFESRVAARTVGIAPAATRRRGRRWPALAAASVLIATGGVAVGYLVADDRGEHAAAPDALATRPLVRPGTDEAVGTVSFADTDDGPVMVVALLDAPAGIAYRCRIHLADGTVVDSDPWPPTERGAWVLDVPADPGAVERIEIVTADGDRVWSSTSG